MTRRSTAAEWAYALTTLFHPAVWREAWRGANRRVEARFGARRAPTSRANVGGAAEDSNMPILVETAHEWDQLPAGSIIREEAGPRHTIHVRMPGPAQYVRLPALVLFVPQEHEEQHG